MEQIVSHHEWTRSMPYPTDKVIVRNLFTQAKAGTDVWGRKQQQPALISITLHLSKPFDSAAQRDTVDQSTVHYGILSKAVKSTIENPEEDWRSTAELASVIEAVIWKCAPTTDLIAAFEIEISYPKGSILGDGVSYLYCKSFPDGQSTRGLESRVLHLKNMRLPCMIGANDHERFRKQAIVANLWVDALGNLDSGDSYTNAEDILVKVIEPSSFATLESLAAALSDKLFTDFTSSLSPLSSIKLRLEKPVAVSFADAPAIETIRHITTKQ